MIAGHGSIEPMHPGELLREDILPALCMSEHALADALRISRQTLNGILNEEQSVTPEMAVSFGELFGDCAGFWVNLQRTYDEVAANRIHPAGAAPTPDRAATSDADAQTVSAKETVVGPGS